MAQEVKSTDLFKELKKICEGSDKARKEAIAKKMAKRIDEQGVCSLLGKLAKNTYFCRMQVIYTLRHVKIPNEKVLEMLNYLLADHDPEISSEASRILNSFTKIGSRGDIEVILESAKAMKRTSTTVRLKLKNQGNDPVENIVISILPSDDFTIEQPSKKNLKILGPNDSHVVEFSIKVKHDVNPLILVLDGTFSVKVVSSITFIDAEKEEKTLCFTDSITFYPKKEVHHFVKAENPYIPGIPLKTPEMFYGRGTLLKDIEKSLKPRNRTHVLILYGQRRTGKTSILYQLHRRLGNEFVPVFLDLQGIPSDTETFFYWMALEIWRELSRRHIVFPEPEDAKFHGRPEFHFRDVFLQKVRTMLGHRKLVLMMDEFETIDDKIRRGKIDKDVLPFLRNLMQHSDNIDFIFSGTHRLEEMNSDYWSTLFNIGLYYKISFLELTEAEALICEPVRLDIEYDPLAVKKILELTAGHPYFVQLICYHLIDRQLKEKRNQITIEDVKEVVDAVLVAGDPYFESIWSSMTRAEQIVLLGFTNIMSSQSISTVIDIVSYLRRYHFKITGRKVEEILEGLLKNEIIERKIPGHYQFKVELIKLWCEKTKELQKPRESETHE